MMQLKKLNKKGLFHGGKIEGVIVGVIGVVILFFVIAELLPTLFASGDAINASGIPFGEFFSTGGLVWLILAAGLLIYSIKLFMGKGSASGKY